MKPARTLAIRVSIVATLCILILGYGLFQARNLLMGPSITLTSPINGDNVSDPLVAITGVAKNITLITLNDRQIFVDKQGNFSEKLLVPPGYTIIKLAARDKFGRTTEKLLELNYTALRRQLVASSTLEVDHEEARATSTDIIIQNQ